MVNGLTPAQQRARSQLFEDIRKADPAIERAQSRFEQSPLGRRLGRGFVSGGGGGRPTPTPAGPPGISPQEKAARNKQITQNLQQQLKDARQSLQSNLRGASLNARLDLLNKFRQDSKDFRSTAQLNRVSQGVLSQISIGGERVTQANVSQFKAAKTPTTRPTEGLRFIGRQDITRPDKVQPRSLEDIRRDFLKLPGVKQLKAFEEKRFAEGRGPAFAMVQAEEARAKITKKGKPVGSLTQRIFETAGAEFFKPGERQAIIDQRLQNLTGAQNLEEQQTAIKELREVGINISSSNGEFVVDPQSIPGARVASGVTTGVSIADAFLKSAIFSPFFAAAAAKKGAKAKAKVKVKVQKISSKSLKDVTRAFENEFKAGGSESVQSNLNRLSKNARTATEKANIRNVFNELQKKGLTKDLLLIEKDGGIGVVRPGQSFKAAVKIKPPQAFQAIEPRRTTVEINLETFRVPKIKGAAQITVSPSALKKSAINRQNERVTSLNKQLQQVIQNLRVATTQFQRSSLQTKQTQLTKQIQKQQQRSAQLQRSAQVSLQKLTTQQRLGQATQSRFKGKVKSAPKLKFLLPFSSGGKLGVIKKKKKVVGVSKPGYDALVKRRKSKLFLKLNRVPISKKNATSLAAFGTDNSLSATFKVKKAGKPAKNPKLKFPTNYFEVNRNKFRDFRKSKGKRIPLKNKYIERRKFRLDAPKGERQTIQAFKRKLKLIKPRKKKK